MRLLRLVLAVLPLLLTSCGTDRMLVSLEMIPDQVPMTAIGEQAQLKVIGHYNHSPSTEDLTSVVKWSSSNVDVVTVTSTGLLTATGEGDAVVVADGGKGIETGGASTGNIIGKTTVGVHFP